MNIVDFFSSLKPSDYIPIAGIVLGAILGFILPKESYIPIYKERLEKIYMPMYRILLPYMYKNISEIPVKKIIESLLKISNDNYALTSFIVISNLERHKQLKTEKEIQNNYNLICDSICYNVDECRKYLKLGGRTYAYINEHNQYKNNFSRFCKRIEFVFSFTGIFTIILLVILSALLTTISNILKTFGM